MRFETRLVWWKSFAAPDACAAGTVMATATAAGTATASAPSASRGRKNLDDISLPLCSVARTLLTTEREPERLGQPTDCDNFATKLTFTVPVWLRNGEM